MKFTSLTVTAGLMVIIALTGCEGLSTPFNSGFTHPGAQAQRQVPQQNTTAGAVPPAEYASAGNDCSSLANSRMKMYDRPDTYPLSDREKQDAYNSLYSTCMSGKNWQVAGASHNNVAANEATQLAALTPAAGGSNPAHTGTTVNANGTLVTASAAAGGGTVIVIGGGASGGVTAAQLSSLSPAAGGNPAGQNATVVLVQSPQNTLPVQAVHMPTIPTAPLPVAVPIPPPPMARGYTPASPAVASPSVAAPAAAAAAPSPASFPAPQQQAAYLPIHQPSLAGADATASGVIPVPSNGANAEIENALEK